MNAAYEHIRQTGAQIRTTAREFGVPEASLRHRLCGRVNPESVHSGPQPMFSNEEEAYLVEHIKAMSECGYGYGRAEVVTMASAYAVYLKKTGPSPSSINEMVPRLYVKVDGT